MFSTNYKLSSLVFDTLRLPFAHAHIYAAITATTVGSCALAAPASFLPTAASPLAPIAVSPAAPACQQRVAVARPISTWWCFPACGARSAVQLTTVALVRDGGSGCAEWPSHKQCTLVFAGTPILGFLAVWRDERAEPRPAAAVRSAELRPGV